MKKLYSFALLILVLMSSVILSACGTNYDNLSMSFVSLSGTSIERIELNIDKNNVDLNSDTVRIGVKFEGIGENDIGNIVVQSNPSGLVTTSNYVYEGNTVYFTIKANNPTIGAMLEVKHMASNKVASCDLYIGQKSTDLILLSKRYIVSIPEEGSKDSIIDVSSLLKLYPNGTDDIYFTSQNAALPENVEYLTTNVDNQNFITGFKLNSNVVDGGNVTLYPVTYMKNYSSTTYSNLPIEFVFKRLLSDGDVVLSSDNLHNDYLLAGEPIYLIENDNTAVAVGGQTYGYNNIKLNFMQNIDGELREIDDNYFDFYNYDFYSTSESVKPMLTGEGIVVQANDYTNDVEEVTISLVPKDCVGEIGRIDKKISIKGETKPETIDVYMQGKKVDISESIDLYDDYYQSSSNALGALFTFTPIETYSMQDFKTMKFSIAPEILNAHLTLNNENVGRNPIYSDNTFTTLLTNPQEISTEHTVRNNRYVLEIFVGNQPMKFYYDETTSRLVSETIYENQSIYIRYVETTITTSNYELGLEVISFYSGNLAYLNQISSVSVSLQFNREDGVTNLLVNAGQLSLTSDSVHINTVQNADGTSLIATDVYLNRLNGMNLDVDIKDETVSSAVLYIGSNGVLGINDKIISSATFNIMVSGGRDNPLKLKQYDSINDGNGKHATGETSITYNFNQIDGINISLDNAILFVYDKNTDIGEYKITFTHANGYTLTITCYVYQDLTNEDIDYSIDNNATAFKNSLGENKYLYEDYKADYIVASGQNLNFEVILDTVFTAEHFVTGYQITAGVSTVGNINISNYFDVTASDNSALLSFRNGSYINNENVYFTLNINVFVNYYENILTPAGTKAVSRVITFFIYDKIENNNISINTTNPNLFIYEQLGVYYKDESEVELVVSLTNNNLWNYVQSYEQNTDQLGIDNTSEDNEENGNNLRRVVWTTTNANGLQTLAQTDNSISLRANKAQMSGAYSRTIVAIIKQFNTEFSFVVQVNVREPILTDRIEITSEVSVRDDDRENPYINLRVGESYQITANSYSTDGSVTNPDIFIVVADRFGNSDYNSVQVDNDTSTITVRDSIASTDGLKIIVFARDVLSEIINSYSQGFNDPQSYIIDGEDIHYYQYKNAYIVIDLILSDGTKLNPYLIQNGNEFWQIKEDADAHYRLMTNVDVSNTTYQGERVIDNFTGTITTDSYVYGEGENQVVRTFSYSLFGIELGENNSNLFTNFAGSIENVSFSVIYNYKFTSNVDTTQISTIYLGVFDRIGANEVSVGSLINVNVNASGNVIFNSTDNFVFGALAGRNSGNISYTSNAVIGASVNLQLSGNSQVYFGGLVGENVGTISGYNQDNTSNTSLDLTKNNSQTIDSEIIFSVLIAGEGAMSNITLNSTLTNNNSVIGGVIGVNSYETVENVTRVGTLKDAYVTGSISAQTDNVGGVVGEQTAVSNQDVYFDVIVKDGQISQVGNQYISVDTSITYLSASLENVTSNVQISGRNNIGGIVGIDNGGYYKNVHYQILEADTAYLIGVSNVGGIAGASHNGYFDTCSVMSYRFNYDELKTTFSGVHADIIGEDFVGGIVGLATNSLTTSTLGAGNNSITATLVKNSSVNAYLESQGEGLNAIGGVMSLLEDDPTTTTITEGGYAIVFNSYFLGKLDGNVYYHNLTPYNDTAVALASNSHYYFNIVYTVDVKDDGIVVERSFHTTNAFEIKYNSSTSITEDNFKNNLATYWGYREDLNGGYIFISKVSISGEGEDAVITSLHTPIYELAPTSLSALVKDEYEIESTNTLLHLDYYNFNLDVTNSNYIAILNTLNEKKNSHNLKDLFDFSYTPNSLEEVRIYAISGNLNVITIINDRLVINGVGETTLTFRSILNPQVYATINVIVTLPAGDDFNILDGEIVIENDHTERIALNHAKQYFTRTNGEVEYAGENYSYQTNDEVYLQVEITTHLDNTLDGQDIDTDPYHYLNISGLTPTLDDGSNVIIIPYNVPFSISVKKYIEGVTFIVNVRPFTKLTYNDEEIRNYILNDSNVISFKLIPAFGATNISLDFDHAIMYPNDTTIITAYINTDIKLEDEEINSFISAVQIGDKNVDISDYIEYLSERTSYCQGTNIQTAYFRLNLENLDVGSLNEPIDLVVRFTLTNGRSANAEFTILPQRINKIEINNYIYTSRENKEISKSNVLRPDSQGIILIEIAPENGYYDYLEISDITGEEEIVFTQVDGISGSRLDMNLPSSDGTGIKLVKVNGITYVETRISRNYSTREHTVSVRAYLADGTMIAENKILVDVRMLPGIQLDYIDPNGVVTKTNTDIDYGHDYYLANGVNADFRVTTSNSDGNVDVTLTLSDGSNANGYFEFVLGNNGFYTLRSTYNTNLLGKTLTITVSTRATDENGNYEIAKTQMSLTIVDFVIHNVSVTNSRVDFTSNPPDRIIYGDYNTEVQLEFYLNPTDISFYNDLIEIGDKFWSQTYRYDATLSDDEDASSVEKSLIAINNILEALNTNTAGTSGNNKFITLLNQTEEDRENLTLTGNTLVVESGNRSTILQLQFKLELDKTDGYIWKMSESVSEDITNNILTTLTYTQDYSLEFVNSNSYEDPIVILDEEGFINITSGENVYYILANDLTLRDYTPLDVNFKMFDGNGHTITIQSFAMFGEAEIKAGLFKEIYDGMIVANLTVSYVGRSNAFGSYSANVNDFSVDYADLCQNPDVNYTSANFGGITPINNGIITNCVVEGMVALSASAVENNTESGSSGRYTIDFNIGGLVSTNGSTGYITNSISKLKIFAQANIAGLVHTNNGKIVASEFDASDGNGLIYAYNRNVETTIISSIAGLVVSNTGEISMSNVKVGQTSLKNGKYIGNMSAKDISAGFVYSNSGSIYDAYVNLTRIGENNNTFSGFVNSNSGTIDRTYTFINNGNKSSSVVNMFAPQNTSGITNSIEIMNVTAGYNSRIENLTTLNSEERFVISHYTDLGFTFGDNISAVWTQTSLGILPSLVVEEEIVSPTHKFEVNDKTSVEVEGVGEIEGIVIDGLRDENLENASSNGLRAIVQVKYNTEDESGHITEVIDYITLNNGYGSKNNPYLIYDITSWDNYFTDNSTGYYRLITDIDFSSVYNNPSTADKTFRGNLQGNNMEISGLTIYSSSSLDAIGLFESLAGGNDISIENTVRNLTISANSVLASKTTTVGMLAGRSDNFNIYNVHVDSPNLIVVGKNAVGGIIGLVEGEFDIDNVSSNVGANSTRETSDNSYQVYLSINNNASTNLTNVYYAGSLFGILDGYNIANFDINASRDIAKNMYYEVRNADSTGNITILGDIVGGMFGFVGERVRIDMASANITGTLNGRQYSAGLVGENRGVITNSSVVSSSENMFSSSCYVGGGIVGLNLGGLVMNSSAYINVNTNTSSATAGGVVGRNVNGYVTNVYQSGNVLGYFAGAVIGTSYSRDVFISRYTGSGSLQTVSRVAVPTNDLKYLNSNTSIQNLTNINISHETLDGLFANMRLFYAYGSGEDNIKDAFACYRIYGLLIGAISGEEVESAVANYGYLSENGQFVTLVINEVIENGVTTNMFANIVANKTNIGTIVNAQLFNGALKVQATEITSAVGYDIEYINYIYSSDLDYSYITYLVGAKIDGFDNWNRRSYGTESLAFTNSTEIDTLTLFNKDDKLMGYVRSLEIDRNEYVFNIATTSDVTSITINAGFVQSYFEDIEVETFNIMAKLNNSAYNDLGNNLEEISLRLTEEDETKIINSAQIKITDGTDTYNFIFNFSSLTNF